MKKTFTKLLTVIALTLLTTGAMAQIFVDASKTGGANNGTSWADAYINLQTALENATSGDQIWVAKGIYKPSAVPAGLTTSAGGAYTSSTNDNTFLIPEGVKLYGGFSGAGTENSIEDRVNINAANATILSGDLTGNDDELNLATKSDNVYHVVTIIGHTTGTFVIDGFTMQGGYAIENKTTKLGAHNYYSFYGAGIFVREASGSFKNLVIRNNQAKNTVASATNVAYGGGVFIATTANAQSVNIEKTSFLGNKSLHDNSSTNAHAAGLYSAVTTSLIDVIFDKNESKSSGGGLYLTTPSALENVEFIQNVAGVSGGGMFISAGGQYTFTNVDFDGNTAVTSGGALYAIGTSGNLHSSSFNGGIVENNQALGTSTITGNGGAFYFANYCDPTITNTTFQNNIGNYNGGAFFSISVAARRNSITISGGSFTGNTTTNFRGGAIYLSNYSDLLANGVTFTSNKSLLSHGGALFTIGGATNNTDNSNDNTININNCTFTGNTGLNGGAIHVNTYSTLNIGDNTKFINNIAENNGGAVYIAGNGTATRSRLAVDKAIFIGNTATASNGGAININTYSESTLKSVIFNGNTATAASGGSIYYVGHANNIISSANPVTHAIINSVFSNNTSGTTGGAVTVATTAVDMVGNTFYANTASTDGGAIRLTNSNSISKIHNSIIYGNVSNATTPTPDISNSGSENLDLQYTITQDYGTDAVNDVQVGAVPLFLNTTYGSSDFLKLAPITGNPAIDAGNNDLVPKIFNNDIPPLDITLTTATDLAGVLRFNGTVDLGAYENHTPLPIELTDFSAKANTSSIVVSWITETETNNSHFILERSTDGVNFVTIATPASKGNGAKYSHTDFSPANGANYYRLTQVDNDGTKVTYDPVVVNFSLKANEVSVYPNPAVGNKITVSLAGQKYTSLQLVNLNGQKLQSLTISASETEKTIDVSAYPSGIYFLVISDGVNTITKKVIKP